MIDFTITACDEYNELKGLINYLQYFVRESDNILVYLDGSNTNQRMIDLVDDSPCTLHMFNCDNFRDKFLFQKSTLKNKFVFGLCADEVPTIPLIQTVLKLVDIGFENRDVICVPRINIFTDLHILHTRSMYTGHRAPDYLLREPINEHGWHHWPDYQVRLWQNLPHISWGQTTHTGIIGYKSVGYLPQDPRLSLLHVKTIKQQERILKLYDKIGLG